MGLFDTTTGSLFSGLCQKNFEVFGFGIILMT